MSISDPAASPQPVDTVSNDSSRAGALTTTDADAAASGETTSATATRATPVRPRGKGWFRAFWRWHFYASFLVVPVLLLLAVTGLIYLLRFQLEPMLNADVMTVKPPAGAQADARQSYDSQLAAVTTAHPDATLVSMTEPSALDQPTAFSTTVDGEPLDVYVNPWDATVLGSLNPDTTLSGYAVRLHGELMAGPVGDAVIELAACWALVMAITGYILFVRGRRNRARQAAAKAKGALLRHRHAAVGAVLGVGLLALLVTGLPWTGIWGEKAQQLATAGGSSLWSDDPGALSNPTSTLDESLPHSHDVPWALGNTTVPQSTPGDERSTASIDTAVTVAQREGLARPLTIALPEDDKGVYSVIGYAFNDPGRERTVHVDRYGGTVVSSYGYRDYPVLAKVVAQGISLHEGRRFGTLTFWITIAFCLGVIFMCVTGPLMWWRRRPKGAGTLGAPRGRLPLRTTPLLALVIVGLAVLLPLFGVSLVVILLLDQLLLRRVPRLKNWFATT
ncbi:PepSY domain-containing protein [Actinoplanes sp. ATCC 53533]|uniref:PepSY-associated TM helix domain-containing protein n=1 Tax=Actinoplanes sp. ATCC 53533 TaxID=1288362 RepID=UPI0018F6733A|nr:PepSY domain-containing protein [Actinoplanes sp. ATCC 53533]